MARLIYSAISSLDGYTEDRNGKFDSPARRWRSPLGGSAIILPARLVGHPTYS